MIYSTRARRDRAAVDGRVEPRRRPLPLARDRRGGPGPSLELTDRFCFDLYRGRARRRGRRRRSSGSARCASRAGCRSAGEGAAQGRPAQGRPPLQRAAARAGGGQRPREAGERGCARRAVDAPRRRGPRAARSTSCCGSRRARSVAFSWTGDDPAARSAKAAKAAGRRTRRPRRRRRRSRAPRSSRCRRAGYYDAKVEPEDDRPSGRARWRRGRRAAPKGSSVEVDFEGNKALDGQALPRRCRSRARASSSRRSTAGATALTERAAARVRARRLPARARRGRRARGSTPADGRAHRDDPGARAHGSRVTRDRAAGGDRRAGGARRPEARARTGEPFDVEAYLADRDAIAAWYRAEGWIEARVRGVLEPEGGGVAVSFAARGRPATARGDVRVATKGRTRSR